MDAHSRPYCTLAVLPIRIYRRSTSQTREGAEKKQEQAVWKTTAHKSILKKSLLGRGGHTKQMNQKNPIHTTIPLWKKLENRFLFHLSLWLRQEETRSICRKKWLPWAFGELIMKEEQCIVQRDGENHFCQIWRRCQQELLYQRPTASLAALGRVASGWREMILPF